MSRPVAALLLTTLLLVPAAVWAQDPHLGTTVDAMASDVAALKLQMVTVIDLLKGIQWLLWAVITTLTGICIMQWADQWRTRRTQR